MKHAEKLESLPVDSLVPYARNARTHSPEQVAAVARSIQRFGFTNPVLIDADGGIVAGHGRVLAAKSLGVGSVPCLRVGWLTEAEKRAYVLADNKLAELAGWDDELLAGELRALQADDFDLSLTGFAQDELDDLLIDKAEGKTDPDVAPPVQVEAVTRLGDVWVLGRHRIMCGDSTSAEQVHKLLGGGMADLCFTSPPYGAANVAKIRDHYVPGADHRKSFYVDHEDRPDEWLELMRGWYAVAREISKTIACNVQMLADNKVAMLQWLYDVRESLCDVVVWDKGHGAPQMQARVLNNAFEFVFIFGGNGSRAIEFADWHGSVANVVRINPKGKNDFAEVHRAVMPVDLALWVMQTLCPRAMSIYEPFTGSGTTIIAAEQTGRRCYAMELSPQYVDVAVRRWQEFTGQRAVREADGMVFPA